MSAKKVLVLGGSFGGLNAALELKKRLGDRAEVNVLSRDPRFVFIPSLPWVAMGWRRLERVSLDLASLLTPRGVVFEHATATRIDAAKQEVTAGGRVFPYDYLLVATGSENDWAAVPGLGPAGGHTHSILTPEDAVAAREAVGRLLAAESGSIVIGNAPGASCLGPPYELAFILDRALRRLRKRHRFTISFVTCEPSLGHFGVGGMGAVRRLIEDEFADRDIEARVDAAVAGVTPDAVELKDGSRLQQTFAMIVPAFLGVKPVREAEGLANPRGFIPVDGAYRHGRYRNVFAAGVAIAIPSPFKTAVPVNVPKTGHMTEEMALVAAHNLAVEVTGEGSPRSDEALSVICIADMGDTGIYLSARPLLPPRDHLVHKKGRWARWLKVLFERYYLARLRWGLPRAGFGW